MTDLVVAIRALAEKCDRWAAVCRDPLRDEPFDREDRAEIYDALANEVRALADALEAERGEPGNCRAWARLASFAKHASDCATLDGDDCTCGFNETRTAALASRPAVAPALRAYVRHLPNCLHGTDIYTDKGRSPGKCTCGLEAVLKGEEE